MAFILIVKRAASASVRRHTAFAIMSLLLCCEASTVSVLCNEGVAFYISFELRGLGSLVLRWTMHSIERVGDAI